MSSIEYINSVVLTASAAGITFTNIPSYYQDLMINFSGKTTGSSWVGLTCQVGNTSLDTGNNYSETYLYGTGSSAASTRSSNASYMNLSGVSNSVISSTNFNFLSYSDSNIFKTVLAEGGPTDGWIKTTVGLWRSTNVINTIKIYHPTDSLAASTTATLWGVR